jgi:monothiol glutaredoxin
MFRIALRSSVRGSFLSRTAPSTTLLTSHHLTAYRYISQEARSKIQSAIDSKPVVLFMKGTPAEPQCGFSRAVVQILDIHGVVPEKMKTYNVLADDELRTSIKEFSLVPISFFAFPVISSLAERMPLFSSLQ